MNQRHEPRLLSQVMRHEGFRDKPYLDSQGHQTVGYGRNLDANGISQDEAIHLLRHDLNIAEQELEKYQWFYQLSNVRKDALVNMMFNIGATSFAKFHNMIDFLAERNYSRAAEEMLDSKYARQVKGRAKELAMQLETGIPQ